MIENKVLVTIAIPFYNSEKYLVYAIRSVINQTYRNWELLLMDDGGKDGSMSIAREYASRDARIRVVSDGENRGLACRLNESIAMAKGEIYARMDDDDIMAIDRIETQVKFLATHPEVDVVGSSAMIIDGQNEIIGSHDMSYHTQGFLHPTVMGRTKWFRENPYAEWCRRSQDKELWMRTAPHSTFVNLQRPLLFYREVGTVSFEKYMRTRHASMAIAKHYRDYGKSSLWFIKEWIRNYIRIVSYYFFSKIGKIDYLVRRRDRHPISSFWVLHKTDLEQAIKMIKIYTC